MVCPIDEKTRMPRRTGTRSTQAPQPRTRTVQAPPPRTRNAQTAQICRHYDSNGDHGPCTRAKPGETHRSGGGLWYHPKSDEKQKGRMARK